MKKGQKSTRDRMLWRDMFPMAKREKLHWTWKITHTRIRTFRGTSNIIVNIFKEITLTNEHDKVLSKEILFRVSMNYRVSMTIVSARKVKGASNMSTGEIRKCHLGRECFADVIHSLFQPESVVKRVKMVLNMGDGNGLPFQKAKWRYAFG